MRVIKDTSFEFGWVVSQIRPPAHSLTAVVKATFAMTRDGLATVADEQRPIAGEAFYDDDEAQSLRFDGDLAVLKPRGEYYLAGTCFAPGGRPTGTTAVAVSVGSAQKGLAVFGDRFWRRTLPSEPKPFTEMPLRYERSFGGPGFALNPLGVGIAEQRVEGTARRPLPNIEDPNALIADPSSRPDPAGLFPYPPTWRQRMSRVGTFDERWLAQRWPAFPEDFDYSFFNAAPADQQIKGYWRGDEEIALQNLRPKQSRFRTQLPGLRARVFLDVKRMNGNEFVEVPLQLDTIAIDADAEQVVCLFRGVATVSSPKLTDIDHVFVMHEAMHAHSPVEVCRERFDQALLEADGLIEVLDEEPEELDADELDVDSELTMRIDVLKARLAKLGPRDPAFADDPTVIGDSDELLGKLRKRNPAFADDPTVIGDKDDLLAKLRARDPAHAEDPTVIGEPLPRRDANAATVVGPAPTKRDPDAPTMFGPMPSVHEENVETVVGEAPSRTTPETIPPSAGNDDNAPKGPSSPREALAQLAARGIALPPGMEALIALDAPPPREPPEPSEAERLRALRARVLAAREAGTSLADEDLTGVELAGESLAGMDFTGAILQRAKLRGANLDAAKLDEAVLEGATLIAASLRGASLAKADLTRIDAGHADFEGATLSMASLASAALANASFRGANLAGADLANANLADARFDEAKLDGANLSTARMERAKFHKASLVSAALERVEASGATFDEADLTKANLSEGGQFEGATFLSVKAPGANFTAAQMNRADLSQGTFERADFSQALLVQSRINRCELGSATFRDARLVGAEMLKSNARDANFEGADLSHADLRGANLFGAELVNAITEGVRLELANVKRTRLA